MRSLFAYATRARYRSFRAVFVVIGTIVLLLILSLAYVTPDLNISAAGIDTLNSISDSVLFKPIDIYVSPKSRTAFKFSLDHDYIVSIATITKYGSQCQIDSFDDVPFYDFQQSMTPRGMNIESYSGGKTISAHTTHQIPLTAGTHTIVFISIDQGVACHSVLYLYPAEIPVDLSVNKIEVGKTYTRTLLVGHVDSYYMDLTKAPQTVAVQVTPTKDKKLRPVVRLYGPDGRVLATDTYNEDIGNSLLYSILLETEGRYTITIQDWNLSSTGDYRLVVGHMSALNLNVGDVKGSYLPYSGSQFWTVNVIPTDLTLERNNIRCVAYSLIADRPAPTLPPSEPSGLNFQFRTSVGSQPGIYVITAANDSAQSGGQYIFGCANVGRHDTVGIGGSLRFKGDYFTRFLPAMAKSSAEFALQTSTNRRMHLELRLGNDLIGQDTGANPTFTVVFPKDGIYTLIGRGAPGTSPAVVAQTISIKWTNNKLSVYQPVQPAGTSPIKPTSESTPAQADGNTRTQDSESPGSSEVPSDGAEEASSPNQIVTFVSILFVVSSASAIVLAIILVRMNRHGRATNRRQK